MKLERHFRYMTTPRSRTVRDSLPSYGSPVCFTRGGASHPPSGPNLHDYLIHRGHIQIRANLTENQ